MLLRNIKLIFRAVFMGGWNQGLRISVNVKEGAPDGNLSALKLLNFLLCSKSVCIKMPTAIRAHRLINADRNDLSLFR